jgi:hypothetical protein
MVEMQLNDWFALLDETGVVLVVIKDSHKNSNKEGTKRTSRQADDKSAVR